MIKEKIELKVTVEISYKDEEAKEEAIKKSLDMGHDFSSVSTAGFTVYGLASELLK